MIRILIVEDDENISKMLAATLSIGDYEYDAAQTAKRPYRPS